MNCKKASLPTNIDGASGVEQITELWQKHYCEILNAVKSGSYSVGHIDKQEDVIVSPQEIFEIAMKLDNNKACGMEGISADHLKYASRNLYPLLAICFTGFLVHA